MSFDMDISYYKIYCFLGCSFTQTKERRVMSPKAKARTICCTIVVVGVLTIPMWFWLAHRSPNEPPVNLAPVENSAVSHKSRPVQKHVPTPNRRELPDPDHRGRKIIPLKYRAVELPVAATEYFRNENGWIGIVVETKFERSVLGEGTLPVFMEVRALPEVTVESLFRLGMSDVRGKNPHGKHVSVWNANHYNENLWELEGEECEEEGTYTLRFFLHPRWPLEPDRLKEVRGKIENGSNHYRFRMFLLAYEGWFGKPREKSK